MEPTEENLRAWDAAHRQVERGEHTLPPEVRASLSDLKGKRVLHVGCGSGAATLEFVELGASVTGVDASDGALELARQRGPTVLWVHGEPDSLPSELHRGRFDLVYAGPETTQGVRDLDHFATGVAASLRAGGDLLLYD
jgi:ubiquinone/menaquinone biosynthesis C-methylase UbiE